MKGHHSGLESEGHGVWKSRWPRLATFFAVVGLLCCIGWRVDHNTALHPNHPLVGSWSVVNPEAPGTTRYLALNSNGRFNCKDVVDGSETVLQNVDGYWHMEAKTIVIKERRRGLAMLLTGIPGFSPPAERIPVISVNDSQFCIGNREHPIVYQRVNAVLYDR